MIGGKNEYLFRLPQLFWDCRVDSTGKLKGESAANRWCLGKFGSMLDAYQSSPACTVYRCNR